MTIVETTSNSLRGLLLNAGHWLRQRQIGRIFAIALVVLAIVSGVVTYALLTRSSFSPDAGSILILLNIDLVILLLLAVVITRHVVKIWSDRRRGSAGSRLHVRLALLFGLISVVPTIIMALFSALFFNFGIESWFSERVRTALQESSAVAEAYLEEHKRNIVADALRMARDIDNQAPSLVYNQERLIQAVGIQARVRKLTEAVIFTGGGNVIARSGLTGALEFEPVPPDALEKARDGEVAVLTSANEDRVRALLRLDNFIDSYLYVGRFVDPAVLGHSELTRDAVDQFESLELRRADIQISFVLVFAMIALLLLLAAVWVGLNVATSLSGPVSALISATEKIRSGDMSARVAVDGSDDDEIDTLGRAFNRMTNDLESSRRELLEANQQIDARRIFTETVLSGVSAGVIGLDSNGRITLPNSSASQLLGLELEQLRGEPLGEVVPEFRALFSEAQGRTSAIPTEQQVVVKQGADQRTLLVRIGAVQGDNVTAGFVVTFDDISALLSAQRKAAWADVARRIAHEIKNPLTPIQLSAERLARRYLKQVDDESGTFQTCIDTIVRQVETIGRMVDEFSSFARMPAPVIRRENINDLCRQGVFLHRNSHPHITYEEILPEDVVVADCDGRLISQAITNLLLNAAEAIEGRTSENPPPGRIVISVSRYDGNIEISVDDNGKGLPEDGRENLMEPYVTSRAKGTGLGLAIVRKIMEDHQGQLMLDDSSEGGARVRMVFPEAVPVPDRPAGSETEQATRHGA
ncbi:MAG: PAS domain-containing sensor histidine kinase [Alphaproteobacteria bacterium]